MLYLKTTQPSPAQPWSFTKPCKCHLLSVAFTNAQRILIPALLILSILGKATFRSPECWRLAIWSHYKEQGSTKISKDTNKVRKCMWKAAHFYQQYRENQPSVKGTRKHNSLNSKNNKHITQHHPYYQWKQSNYRVSKKRKEICFFSNTPENREEGLITD